MGVQLKQRTVSVVKEGDELAEMIGNLTIETVRAARDNGGWKSAEDIPKVFLSLMKDAPKAVDGFDQIGEEVKTELGKFLLSWAIQGERIASELLSGKPELAALESFSGEVVAKVTKKTKKKTS